jgi:signal transduction histidine kinase
MPIDNNSPQFVIQTLDSLWKLEKIILNTLDFNEVVDKVVDGILHELGYLEYGYNMVSLSLVNKDRETLERISVSQTEKVRLSFQKHLENTDLKVISLSNEQNISTKAVKQNKPQQTSDLYDIFLPNITREKSEKIQAESGIKTVMIYPLEQNGKVIGVLTFGTSKDRNEIQTTEIMLINYFRDFVTLSIQNSMVYSELEKKNEYLENANQKLTKLDKNKDEFISITSHELRTPMSIIKSYLWMLQTERAGPLNERQKEYLTKAMSGSERMINLINDMLSVSRIEQGRIDFKMEKINLGDFLGEIIDELKLKADEKDLYIKSEIKNGTKEIYADKIKLREILVNLISNSIKFTDGGGVVVGVEEEGDYIKISVTDTGRGIDKAEQGRLFHKFQRLDDSYRSLAEASQNGGSGLGLYIVKIYAQKHGWYGRSTLRRPGIGKYFLGNNPQDS